MPIETATYINGLVATNPVHTDGVLAGDSHLRLIKSTLLATFPAVTGAVTASHTALNATTGLTAALATLTGTFAGYAPLAGADFTGHVNGTSIQQNGVSLIPTGIITLWFGSVAAVPAGWTLCDGTHGTPNLVGQFVPGAGSSPVPYQTGGQNTQTLSTSTISGHSHGGTTGTAGAHAHTGTTDVQGLHSHSGATQPYTLTVNDLPPHAHSIQLNTAGGGGGGTGEITSDAGAATSPGTTDNKGGGASHAHVITLDGSHAHNVTTSTDPGHAHSISLDGSHAHTLSIDVRPAYTALCYIMKL